MKKSTTFIFTCVSLLIIHTGLSQAFFIPEYETKPRSERLPPIPIRRDAPKKPAHQSLKKFNQNYEVEKYVMVNGVFTPVFKKKELQHKKQVQQDNYKQDHPQVIQIAQPEPENEPTIKQEEILTVEIEPIQPMEEDNNTFPKELGFTPINPSLPPYKNIYSQYLLDTKVFKQTGKFPHNKNLETALNKMTSNKQHVVYSGIIRNK